MSSARKPAAEAKKTTRTRTTMNIDHAKLRKARRVLGTKTDTEAVDRALDLVLTNAEINSTIDQAFGLLPDFSIA
jgi:Arc/MetJ family transcription regulator